VVDLPKLQWDKEEDHSTVGCSQDSISLGGNIKIYGYGPWVVKYQIEKGTIDGDGTFHGGSVTSVDSTIFGTVHDQFPVEDAAHFYSYMFLPGSPFTGVSGDSYQITFKSITDRFSRKSLDYLAGTVPSGGAVGSGTFGDPTFVITIIDPPKTKKLRHVKNNRG
jgi:hypothetical protein